jgi:hypothetical protein
MTLCPLYSPLPPLWTFISPMAIYLFYDALFHLRPFISSGHMPPLRPSTPLYGPLFPLRPFVPSTALSPPLNPLSSLQPSVPSTALRSLSGPLFPLWPLFSLRPSVFPFTICPSKTLYSVDGLCPPLCIGTL